MEYYIHQYLSENYYVDNSTVGNDGIYQLIDTNIVKIPYNGNQLIKEIVTIFSLEESEVKTIITNWAISKKKTVNLGFYWKMYTYSGGKSRYFL